MFGWQGNSLQQALNSNCEGNVNCGGLTLGQPNTYNGCKVGQVATETVEGCKFPSLSLQEPQRSLLCSHLTRC